MPISPRSRFNEPNNPPPRWNATPSAGPCRHFPTRTDQLKSKMSPGQMMDEVTGYLKDGDVNKLFVNLKDQVSRQPAGTCPCGQRSGMADDGLRHAPHRLQFQRPRAGGLAITPADRPRCADPGTAGRFRGLLVGFPRLTAPTPNRSSGASGTSGGGTSARARQA